MRPFVTPATIYSMQGTTAGRTDFAESAEDDDIEFQRALELSLQFSEGTAPPNVLIQSSPTYSRLFCIAYSTRALASHTHTYGTYLIRRPHTQTAYASLNMQQRTLALSVG